MKDWFYEIDILLKIMILTVDLSLERLGVLKEVLCINAVMKNNL